MTVSTLTPGRIRQVLKLLPQLSARWQDAGRFLSWPPQPTPDATTGASSLADQMSMHLQEWTEEAGQFLADYYRLIEIAGFVRSGGVKAMIYRLETGMRNVTTCEYFDEVTARLKAAGVSPDMEAYPPASHSLIDRLRSVSDAEEAAVRAVLPEIDRALASLGQPRLSASPAQLLGGHPVD
jgi:hypothetical protein